MRAPPAGPKKQIVLLGAGFVSPPVVELLSRRLENNITIVHMQGDDIDKLTSYGKYRGQVHGVVIDVGNEPQKVEPLVQAASVVISLLPQPFHPVIAKMCIKHKRHMVTASYVSPAMQKLDAEAKAAGILLLNEMGVDPGIDHMSALKMIADARVEGCDIVGFASLCGGSNFALTLNFCLNE